MIYACPGQDQVIVVEYKSLTYKSSLTQMSRTLKKNRALKILYFLTYYRSVNLKSNLWASGFFQKQTKLTILSKEYAQDSEFRLFFGRIEETTYCLRDLLTFTLFTQKILDQVQKLIFLNSMILSISLLVLT